MVLKTSLFRSGTFGGLTIVLLLLGGIDSDDRVRPNEKPSVRLAGGAYHERYASKTLSSGILRRRQDRTNGVRTREVTLLFHADFTNHCCSVNAPQSRASRHDIPRFTPGVAATYRRNCARAGKNDRADADRAAGERQSAGGRPTRTREDSRDKKA